MAESTASDSEGYFQFNDVIPGKYFALYDSTKSDFAAGMEKWAGKTLVLSDVNWILREFCPEDEEPTLFFAAGTSFGPEWQSVLARGLFICDSPFVVAIDPDKTESSPLVLEVVEGENDIVIAAGSFSD
jgi:hypothetical protein